MDKNQNMSGQQKNQLEYLLQQYAEDHATPGELQELSGLLQENKYDEELIQILSVMATQTPAAEEYSVNDVDNMILRILQKETLKPAAGRVHFLKSTRWWWAAACIALILCLGSYFFFFNKQQTPERSVTAQGIKAPDKNRAMITLTDGRQVYLDSAAKGDLAKQGNTKLIKLDNGQISYVLDDKDAGKEMQYNTLFNPRGSKVIDMTLTDGSHVWLNAGSSVTYPVAFNGADRRVTITGEAYFEVAHNPAKPFKVTKGDLEITVLGTHFNVNTYDDDENNKVTLLEGSIKLSTANNEPAILKPGQQALIHQSLFTIDDDADVEQAIAWKNGWFQFNSLGVEEIMREISRWYDVEVVYAVKPALKHFTGILRRDSNVTDVLKIMEQTGIVHFKIEGKKITVTE